MSIGSSGGGVARAWGTAARSTGRRTGATATNGGSDPTATNGGVGDKKIRQQFVSARAVCLRLERMGRGWAARDLYGFDL